MAGKKTGASGRCTALVLVGAAKPRMRKASKRDWTVAKTVTFLTALAETCNVTRAAEQAGVSTGAAYDRRKKDAGFRAGWAEAIATAYQRLELELLERSLNGTEKLVKRRDGSEELMRDYSNQTALALLRMHRDSAVEAMDQPAPEDVKEIRERLVQKLERLRRRYAEDGGAAK